MHHITAPTLHELHDTLAHRIQYAHRDELDFTTGMDSVLEHVYAEADSMEYIYDLKRVWVPPSRWTMMVRQYLDPDDVEEWLATIRKRIHKLAGRPVLRTRIVTPRKGGKTTVRNLGSCMLTISATIKPVPRITLHSRACYVGYLSPLDLGVAYHLGRLVAAEVNIPIEEFRFSWFLETAQMHKFRTIAYVLGDEAEEEYFYSHGDIKGGTGWSADYPAARRVYYHHKLWTKWNEEGLTYDEMPKFQSYRRLRKRWLAERFGHEYALQFEGGKDRAFPELPSTPIQHLDFSKIGIESP